MSIPLLISVTRPNEQTMIWRDKSVTYSTVFYALCLSLNLFVTTMIAVRIYMLRKQVETVAGKLHADFYTSFVTIFVESGAFFTAWTMTHVIMSARKNNHVEILLLPNPYVLVSYLFFFVLLT
jgi:hypothetical protein